MRTRNLMIAFAMTGFIFSTACADNKKDNEPKEAKEMTAEKGVVLLSSCCPMKSRGAQKKKNRNSRIQLDRQ